MGRDKKIQNALKRSEVHRKSKREKAQAKLKRRMEIRKEETDKSTGKEKREQRLAKNVPRTLDNTRVFDSSSYLTADPRTLQQHRAGPSKRLDEEESGSDLEDDDDEDMAEAGPSTTRRASASAAAAASAGQDGEDDDEEDEAADGDEADEEEPEEATQPPGTPSPPRILITTSASPCKETYAFCEDLKNVFPGGEFFKRPKGRGFELGRISRWAIKRGYNAMVVVNEDHKTPNAITLIVLPAGPTAYFKLTSVQLGSQIFGHAKPSPHSPELILNNFTTLLGNSVGRLFGSLFPPQPQFRGRQVVTLHNQRDFLFFRRHRYMFASPTSAKLQEIGPRFTLKLRWLKKGLPSVTAADGSIPRAGGKEMDDDDELQDQDEMDRTEGADEREAMKEMNSGASGPSRSEDASVGMVPPLDDDQEYEWKWKPKMEVSRRTFFL